MAKEIRMRRLGWGLAASVLALAAGCHRGQPGGQVVASVNGEDVTLQELNTELQGTNISSGTDKQLAQRALLQRVIERKLIDGLAKQKGIDTSPEYLAQRRRTEELLLGQLYAKQQMAAIPVPTPADITKFMADNPGIFANHQQLMLDQIRFSQPTNPNGLNGLEAMHSMDAVAGFLTAHGIKFDRQPAGLDSAAVPAALLTQIDRLPAGEPFVIPTAGMLTINAITGRRPVANDPQQARAVAAAAWRQQKMQQAVTDQITAARNSAKITYQKGFEPPAPKAGSPAPTHP